jgi:hypothetical protein
MLPSILRREQEMRQIELSTRQPGLWSKDTKPGTTGRHKKVHNSWYRGENTRFSPNLLDMESADAIEDFILKGWLPDQPYISENVNVTAFGSCFAENISKWLRQRNYKVLTKEKGDAYVIVCSEGMVNSFAILGQFEWALENRAPTIELWHGHDTRAFGYDETVRLATRDIFMKTDVFILTFGLSEIWYDAPSGEVFWRAVPYDKFDPERHRFRVSTVEENTRNIRSIYQLIRKHRPDAKVIVTLSPIPLNATFRDVPCISANSVSKAILRAAVDNVVSEFRSEGHLFYWPSYEIVMEAFSNRWIRDRRHVKQEILDYVMTLFEKAWCVKKPSQQELDLALMRARVAEGSIPRRLMTYVQRGQSDQVESILKRWEQKGDRERAAFFRRWMAANGTPSVPPPAPPPPTPPFRRALKNLLEPLRRFFRPQRPSANRHSSRPGAGGREHLASPATRRGGGPR